MLLTALVVATLLGAEPAADEAPLPTLPAGWAMPRPIKKSVCQTKDRYVARADFDGDGKEDVAVMLTNDEHTALGVWVWLASKKKAPPVQIATFEREDGKHEMGIKVVEPGAYDTACGKGLWECKPGEPAKLTVKSSALDLFTCEHASQYAWWNTAKKKFETVAMTDQS